MRKFIQNRCKYQIELLLEKNNYEYICNLTFNHFLMAAKTNSIVQTSRNNMIQVFRALSIISVVMIHTTPLGECQAFCRPFINFSVATFLFLSGYLTKIENDNWFSFCKKRIIRVLIPYVIWTAIYTLPSIISGQESVLQIAKNLVTARAAATLYYIFVYIQFVLLTPFLSKLAKSKYRNLGWFVAPVSMIIFKYSFWLTDLSSNSIISLFWTDACLGWFTFYYLGLLLGNKILKPQFSLKNLTFIYIAALILEAEEGYGLLRIGEVDCGTQLKLTSLLSSSIFLLIVYTILDNPSINIKSRVLRSIGDLSFGIYLCHIMIMLLLERVSFYNVLPFPLTSVIVVLISWGFCYFANRICSSKLSRWLGLQ